MPPLDLESTNYSYGPETFSKIIEAMKADAGLFLPELSLAATICGLFLITLVVPARNQRNMAWAAMLGLVGVFFTLGITAGEESRLLFQGMIAHDTYATFFKFLFTLSAIVVVLLSYFDRGLEGLPMGEYYAILLSSVLGMFLLASATDFLMIFLALELVSIPTYILVVFRKYRRDSSEAALKYVVYGSVAGAIMIYGMSLLYGFTGSTAIADLTRLQVGGVNGTILLVAGLLTFAGFAYKIAAFPMHFWAPDVYQGAPTAVTAFLSVASKAAGFAGLMRFLHAMDMGEGIHSAVDMMRVHLDWPLLIGIVAAVSMTFGNLAALFQTNVKRMLAYSSIAQAGYLLMGVAAIRATGAFDAYSVTATQAVSYYLLVFLFTNLGAFGVVILFERRTGRGEVDDYRGFGHRAPIEAICLTICLVSLIGIPPTGGFVGKFLLMKVAVGASMVWLAIVAGLNSAISVYYYLRLVKNMFFESADDESLIDLSGLARWTVGVMALGVLVLGIRFASAAEWVKKIELFHGSAHEQVHGVDALEGATSRGDGTARESE
jgi:NADH-quinone oxidoreductase subunit N